MFDYVRGPNPDKITAAIKASGLKQSEIAKRLNITQQAVSMWVNQVRRPAPGHVVALADLFGIDMWDLM
ncbi:hypothetical protein GCM10009836_52180 [Pseudonocardia ailaonensis]|uniref:HTH cro/C1-type domain-containing protein n=1 Tax=Pseudonocardia ailaonensis TaxID=367279 RepID=A0ABN2NE71_9PSEU